MEIWLILPAFNEGANLSALLEGIAATIGAAGIPYGVIVVDDGSTDDTRAVAGALGEHLPVQVVAHPHNRGLARTIETGLVAVLSQANGTDVVVTMDADNTHPPDLIPRMVEEIRRGADLVIASRYAPGGAEEGVPLLRRVLSHGIGVLMRLRFGLHGVRDYSSGYRAYRAQLLHAATKRYGARLIESPGFTVMAELLLKLQPFRPRVVEVPLHLRYDRKRGGSKMRVLQTVVGYLSLLFTRLPAPTSAEGVNRL